MIDAPQANGHFEPSLTLHVLRGCHACHAPHPFARTPPQPGPTCPDCGAAAAPPESRTVPAHLVGDATPC